MFQKMFIFYKIFISGQMFLKILKGIENFHFFIFDGNLNWIDDENKKNLFNNLNC